MQKLNKKYANNIISETDVANKRETGYKTKLTYYLKIKNTKKANE